MVGTVGKMPTCACGTEEASMLEYAWISKPEAVGGGEIEILSYVSFQVCGGVVVVGDRRVDPISKMGCG